MIPLNETTFVKPQVFKADEKNQLPEGVLVRAVYPICNVGELNANNRVYESDVWEKVLSDPVLQEKMSNRNLWGQAEHPVETQSDLQLTSHVVTKMWLDENTSKVYQEVEVLDTPCGRVIEALFKANCPPGVSTRAEGDLEEFELDEGEDEPKMCQRVVAESYNFVTVDFTADPSTYGAAPKNVELKVMETVTALVKENKMTLNEKKFATQVLNSVKCKECKCGKDKCKVQALVLEMGNIHTCLGCGRTFNDPADLDAHDLCTRCQVHDKKATDDEDVNEMEEGCTECGNLAVGENGLCQKCDEEEQRRRDRGASFPGRESKLPECNLPTEGGVSSKVAAGNLLKKGEEHWKVQDVGGEGMAIVKIGEPGSEKTLSWDEVPKLGFVKIGESVKEMINKEDLIDHIVYLVKEESTGDRVHQGAIDDVISVVEPDIREIVMDQLKADGMVVEAKKVKEDASDPAGDLIAIANGRLGWSVAEQMKKILADPTPNGIEDAELNSNAVRMIYRLVKGRKDAESIGVANAIEDWVEEDLGDPSVLEAIKEAFKYTIDNLKDRTQEEVENLYRRGVISQDLWEEYMKLWQTSTPRYGSVGKGYESRNQTIDHKVSEAIAKAERDVAVDALNVVGDRNLQHRIVQERATKESGKLHLDLSKLGFELSASDFENASIRKVLETKAEKLAGAAKAILLSEKNFKGVVDKLQEQITEAESKLSVQHKQHQEELTKVSEDSLNEGRKEIVEEYFSTKLKSHKLQIDENTRALLEDCISLQDVDILMEKLVKVARRSALHSKPLTKVEIQETIVVDPEEKNLDSKMGNLMSRMNY